MRISGTLAASGALAASLAVALAACDSSGSVGSTGSTSPAAAPQFTYNQGPSGGSAGGTLRVLAQSDLSTYDTAAVYDPGSAQVARLFARQLYSYAASNDQSKRLPVVADLAQGDPQVSADGKTYTIKIKNDARWNIGGHARPVTAQDAVLGLKMICNPAAEFGATSYFTDAIVGEQAFCDGFEKVDASSAAAIKKYALDTPVVGLKALDASTLQITLTAPTDDFVHYLALTAASPAPVESLDYVPDSPEYRQHVYSDGPYMVSAYRPDKSLTLVRNPEWAASSDSLRKAYADTVEITFGGTAQTIAQQIQAGVADATLGGDNVPTPDTVSLLASGSPAIHVNPLGGTTPYLVFNVKWGSDAVRNVLVRQAINYAVDKAAVSQDLGGPRIYPVIDQLFSRSVMGAGYQAIDPYPSPNQAGDVQKAKDLLTQAGYPTGITVKFAYYTEQNGQKIATTVMDALAKAGIKVELKGVPNKDYYGNFLGKPSITQSGAWDIAEAGWAPDWEGNSERSYFTPLLDGRTYGPGSSNFGDYNNDAANTLADQALATSDPAKASALWTEFQKLVMKDAPWVPLVEQNQVNLVSARARNFQFWYFASGPDLTNLAVQ